MYKNYKLFLESNKFDNIKYEILSKKGWTELEPNFEHWIFDLRYNLTDDIQIQVLSLSGGNSVNYYLIHDEKSYFVNCYDVNYTKLYSSYRNNNYEMMMKICEYLIPFFTKAPSNEEINLIKKEAFVELLDLGLYIDESENNWGYFNNFEEEIEYGYFPASRHTDKLGICILYDSDNELDFSLIKKEFDECKNRVSYYINNYKSIRIENLDKRWEGDSFRVIISIEF